MYIYDIVLYLQLSHAYKTETFRQSIVLPLCLPQLINLTNEGGTLRPDIKRGEDYEFIPEQVWKSLTFWYRSKYGREGPSLPRYVSEGSEEMLLTVCVCQGHADRVCQGHANSLCVSGSC